MRPFTLPLLALTLTLLGTGCTTSYPTPTGRQPLRSGVALVTSPNPQNGVDIVYTDAETGREFSSILPPDFTDKNGTYTTGHPGESVTATLAIQGTAASDLDTFKKLPSLTTIETARVGAWNVVTAFDTTLKRWVARATISDPWLPDQAHHAIECISIPTSRNDFWDGCATIISHATIGQSTASTGPNP